MVHAQTKMSSTGFVISSVAQSITPIRMDDPYEFLPMPFADGSCGNCKGSTKPSLERRTTGGCSVTTNVSNIICHGRLNCWLWRGTSDPRFLTSFCPPPGPTIPRSRCSKLCPPKNRDLLPKSRSKHKVLTNRLPGSTSGFPGPIACTSRSSGPHALAMHLIPGRRNVWFARGQPRTFHF